jgi:hypothetical protein
MTDNQEPSMEHAHKIESAVRVTMRRNSSIALLLTLAGFAPPALAYLDPSTGSMILSAIIGIIASVGLALKTYWYRIKGFFRKDKPEPSTPQEKVAADESDKAGGQ